MRARYYEPWTGRFISEDKAKDGWNWFVYCKNEPISAIDPTGLFTIVDLLLGNVDAALGQLMNAVRAKVALKWGENKLIEACLRYVIKLAESLDLEDMEFLGWANRKSGGFMLFSVKGIGIGFDISGDDLMIKLYKDGKAHEIGTIKHWEDIGSILSKM